MLGILADKAVAALVRQNAVKEEDSDIYVYGAHLVFSSLVGWTLVLSIGALLGHFWLGVLFLCYVVPTRSYCGGYHADSYLLCNTVFSGTFALTAIAYLFLASKGWLWAAVPFNLFSMAAAVVFAPVENSSRPLIEGEKEKFKIISILIFAEF